MSTSHAIYGAFPCTTARARAAPIIYKHGTTARIVRTSSCINCCMCASMRIIAASSSFPPQQQARALFGKRSSQSHRKPQAACDCGARSRRTERAQPSVREPRRKMLGSRKIVTIPQKKPPRAADRPAQELFLAPGPVRALTCTWADICGLCLSVHCGHFFLGE